MDILWDCIVSKRKNLTSNIWTKKMCKHQLFIHIYIHTILYKSTTFVYIWSQLAFSLHFMGSKTYLFTFRRGQLPLCLHFVWSMNLLFTFIQAHNLCLYFGLMTLLFKFYGVNESFVYIMRSTTFVCIGGNNPFLYFLLSQWPFISYFL